jgi:hypothetical protein
MEWAHLIIETAGLAVLIYQSWQNSKGILKVEHATNGMKAELEAQKFTAGHAAGVADTIATVNAVKEEK